jgi:hypothetical protein
MADANTSSWGNYGMRELSSEPRAAANNSPAWNYAYALEQPWYSWYGAISAAKDGLSSIAAGQEGGKSFLADADQIRERKYSPISLWVYQMEWLPFTMTKGSW